MQKERIAYWSRLPFPVGVSEDPWKISSKDGKQREVRRRLTWRDTYDAERAGWQSHRPRADLLTQYDQFDRVLGISPREAPYVEPKSPSREAGRRSRSRNRPRFERGPISEFSSAFE